MDLPAAQPLDYAAPRRRDPGRRSWGLVGFGLATALLPSTCLFFSVTELFIVPAIIGLACAAMGLIRMRPRAKRRAVAVGILLCALAAVGPFVLTAWLNREGKPIEIVLPVGYRGEFSIVKDHVKGQDLVLRDGHWVFDIPASGILVVKQAYPFMMWHTESFVDSDGHVVKVEDLGTEAGNIVTGPGSSKGSTDYDGTTFRWKVVDSP